MIAAGSGGFQSIALILQVCITYSVDRLIVKIWKYNLKQKRTKLEVVLSVNQEMTGKETMRKKFKWIDLTY